MATEDRASLKATILANLPDNTTEDITPEKHREVEDNIADSHFNKIDEPRGVTLKYAYVAENGNDSTGVVGTESLPFATFDAAIAAVGVNGVVVGLGGTFSPADDNIVINQNNVTLVLQGCTINARILIQADNVNIFATGARIINPTSFYLLSQNTGTHTNINIVGGFWDGGTGGCISFNASVSNVVIRGAYFTTAKVSGDANVWLADINLFDCFFFSTAGAGTCIRVEEETTFNTCTIVCNSGNAVFVADTKAVFNSCARLEGNRAIVGTTALGTVMRVIAEDSLLIGNSLPAVTLTGNCDEIRFTNCTMVSLIDSCVSYDPIAISVSRPANTNNIFEYCTMYAGGANQIFNENYDAGDLGNAEVMNCIFNVAAFGGYTKIVESNTIYKPGLQLVI